MIVYHDTYMWVLKFQKVYYVRGSQSSKHCGILKRHFGKELKVMLANEYNQNLQIMSDF
jgi:hypothetical protein